MCMSSALFATCKDHVRAFDTPKQNCMHIINPWRCNSCVTKLKRHTLDKLYSPILIMLSVSL